MKMNPKKRLIIGIISGSTCRGAKSAGGITIGILPGKSKTDANEYVDIPIVTAMSHSRNAIIVRTREIVQMTAKILRAALLLVFTTLLLSAQNPLSAAKYMKVYYIDWNAGSTQGNGDSIYMEMPGADGIFGTSDDKNAVIDGGSYNDKSKSRWDDFLLAKNISKIDYMVLSHPHSDHMTGLLLIADMTKVSYFYANRDYSGDPKDYIGYDVGGIFTSIKTKVTNSGGQFLTVDPGDILSGPNSNKGPLPNGWDPNVSVKVVSAYDSSSASDYNAQSIIFTIRFGTSSFMFGGDAKRSNSSPDGPNAYGEGYAIGVYPQELKVDIMKAHHHGDYNSYSDNYYYNTPQFMDLVLPKWCVSQDGGSGDLPHSVTLERFRKYGAKIYRNDLDGHILVKADDAGNYDVVREYIRAADDTQSGKLSGSWITGPPNVPVDLRFYNTYQSSVTLAWTAVLKHSGFLVNYDVYMATAANGDSGAGIGAAGFTPSSNAEPYHTGIYKKINNGPEGIDTTIPGAEPGKTITYTVTGLLPSATNYFFRVASIGTSYYYEHRYSNEADGIPPGKVESINGSPQMQAAGAITLTWSAPGGNGNADYFNGYFYIQNTTSLSDALNPSFWNAQSAQDRSDEVKNLAPGSNYSFTLYGLTSGVTYYLRMWSRDQAFNYSAMSYGVTTYASPPLTLNNVYAFPNPLRADSAKSVTFKNLTKYAKIDIFNVAGELVFEIEKNDFNDQYQWGLTNNAGNPVASGTYIFAVTDDAGRQKTGKFIIIR